MVRSIAIFIVFSLPITIGIVRRPAIVSPVISAASLTGDVTKIMVPSISTACKGIMKLPTLVLSCMYFVSQQPLDPSIAQSIIATAIDNVLSMNLFLSATLGVEYINPIDTIINAMIMLARLNVIEANNMPIAFVRI